MGNLRLADLLEITKDGEWGKGEPDEDTVAMLVIRGTDFAAVRSGNLSNVPIRHIPSRIAQRKSLKPEDILIETAGGTKDQPTGRTRFA
jgi:type I restriction enzyme S subunit